jgi:5'(3')-deoxyribonucleotidase
MRLVIDMDEVIVDFMGPLIDIYNKRFKSDITLEDITSWELPRDMKYIFYDPGYFLSLKPITDAIYGLTYLKYKGHDVIIATSPSKEPDIAYQKYNWIMQYLPSFANDLYIANRKDRIDGDLIFDDNLEHLYSSPCQYKMVMDRPWNRYLGGIWKTDYCDLYRVDNWIKAISLIDYLNKEEALCL